VRAAGRIALAVTLLALSAATLPAATARRTTGAKPPADDSDAVLVRIGKEVITKRTLGDRLQEVPEQYRANYQTPEGRQQLLDRMIEERVWMLDAEAHALSSRPDIQRQLASARRDLLIRTWVNEIVSKNPAPTDAELKAYFDEHRTEFKTPASCSVRHIMLRTKPEAVKVLALAKAKGADWNKLVTQFSVDTLTRATGGSLGSVTKEGQIVALGLQPALAESALALPEGAIAGPYQTNKGWHVIKVDTSRPESQHDFEQVRSFIQRTLTQQRQSGYYQEQLGKARARIGVTPDSAAIKKYLSSKKTAREMFQDAQQAGAPQQRIDAYRGVVATWPDADIAPQAQFMVGFIYSEELKQYDDAEKAFRELLARYPKSELATSAQWMVDHMRTEEAPNFPGADSLVASPAARKGSK
jgi:parvulin-like peptidyl-prolyl isomerase